MEQKIEVDFEKWLMSYDISLSFQNIRKKIINEGRNHEILSPNLAKGGRMFNTSSISFSNEMSETKQEFQILNFGIKCREIHHP
jgi:hypothetical protein